MCSRIPRELQPYILEITTIQGFFHRHVGELTRADKVSVDWGREYQIRQSGGELRCKDVKIISDGDDSAATCSPSGGTTGKRLDL